MTEKRFTANLTHYNTSRNYVEGIKDNQSNTELKSIIEIIDLLNELHEENIRLKKEFDSCSHNWALMYDEAKEKVEALTKENWELEQENEKLENKLWNCQNVR